MDLEQQIKEPLDQVSKKQQIIIVGSSIKSSASNTKVYGKMIKPGKTPLSGIKKDLLIMYLWAIKNKIDYRGTMQFGEQIIPERSKTDLISFLKDAFSRSNKYKKTYLYYSGHGDQDGNWVLQSSKGVEYITPREILYLWVKQFPSKQNRTLEIILDQCFAGKWFEALFPSDQEQTPLLQNYGLVFSQNLLSEQTGNQHFQSQIIIKASCKAEQKSQDWGLDEGGAFTATRYGESEEDLNIDQNPQKKEFIIQNKEKRNMHVLKCIREEQIQKLINLQKQSQTQLLNTQTKVPVNKYKTNRQLKVLHLVLAQLIKKRDQLDQK